MAWTPFEFVLAHFHLQLHPLLSETYYRCIYEYKEEKTAEGYPCWVHFFENETRNIKDLKIKKTRYLFTRYTELNYFFVFQNTTPKTAKEWMKQLQTKLEKLRFVCLVDITKLDNKEILEVLRV